MVVLRYVYILVSEGKYFTGTTNDPAYVLECFRKRNPAAKFMLVCMMGYREACRAYKFLKCRMKEVDFKYWEKHSRHLCAQWLYKASGIEPMLASDFSEMYNGK